MCFVVFLVRAKIDCMCLKFFSSDMMPLNGNGSFLKMHQVGHKFLWLSGVTNGTFLDKRDLR